MNFDVLTLSAVRDEIRARAVGGRVQRVVAPAPDQIALEIYSQRTTQHLLINTGHQHPRLHFVSRRSPAGVQPPSPLLLLLRKWVRGGRLVQVAQIPLERVLSLTVQTLPLDADRPVRHDLIVEIIGRQTNIILVDADGRIRDSLRRTTRSGRRIQPRAPYAPPAAVKQQQIASVAASDLRSTARPDLPAWRHLLRSVAGVSPTLAREALARARLDSTLPSSEVAAWVDVLGELRGLFDAAERADWRPSLVPADGDGWQAFAPYELTFLDLPARRYDSMSAALEAYFASAAPARPVDPASQPVAAAIERAVDRAERRIRSLDFALAQAPEAAELRSAGQLLLAHAHAIPPGAIQFEHEGRRIALDPAKDAAANAQDFFGRYRDRQAAERRLPRMLREGKLELAFLRQAADDLGRAESPAVVRGLRDLLTEAGVMPSRRRRGTVATPGRATWTLRGHRLLAGRTAAENQRVTFQDAVPEDLWLHARGLPGAHVLLRDVGDDPDDELVAAAAAVAAYFSAARDERGVDVDVTRRKFVRAIVQAGPGQVTYRNERTIRVQPRAPADVVDAANDPPEAATDDALDDV